MSGASSLGRRYAPTVFRALGHASREPREQLVGRGNLRIVVVCRGHVLEYELVVLVGAEPVADVEAIVDLFEEGQAGFDGASRRSALA